LTAPGDRILIVVAHPDDETLGATVRMSRADSSQVFILHTTDGSPRDGADARALGFADAAAYARARRSELLAALREVGIAESHCTSLGVPDKESFRYAAQIVAELRRVVARIQPDVILTCAYEGGHPDHDTCAACVAALRRELPWLAAEEFPLYHAGPEGQMVTGRFLSDPASKVFALQPDEAERELKRRMLALFVTQQPVLRHFSVGPELFRAAIEYDFSRPPHPGPLLYETWNWGLSWADWRASIENLFHPETTDGNLCSN
jgi:LmbE family N-acetylglucosaminyl deacetylase